MKHYINAIAIGILEVKLSDEASEILRAYFIATRKDRSGLILYFIYSTFIQHRNYSYIRYPVPKILQCITETGGITCPFMLQNVGVKVRIIVMLGSAL